MKIYKSDKRWGAWVLSCLASFAVLQALGFRDYPDYKHTLSATTRRWLGVYPQRPRRLASTMGMLGLFGVYLGHTLTQPPPYHAYPDPDERFHKKLTTDDLPLCFRPTSTYGDHDDLGAL